MSSLVSGVVTHRVSRKKHQFEGSISYENKVVADSFLGETQPSPSSSSHWFSSSRALEHLKTSSMLPVCTCVCNPFKVRAVYLAINARSVPDYGRQSCATTGWTERSQHMSGIPMMATTNGSFSSMLVIREWYDISATK